MGELIGVKSGGLLFDAPRGMNDNNRFVALGLIEAGRQEEIPDENNVVAANEADLAHRNVGIGIHFRHDEGFVLGNARKRRMDGARA